MKIFFWIILLSLTLGSSAFAEPSSIVTYQIVGMTGQTAIVLNADGRTLSAISATCSVTNPWKPNGLFGEYYAILKIGQGQGREVTQKACSVYTTALEAANLEKPVFVTVDIATGKIISFKN